jgi:hypothetical protein
MAGVKYTAEQRRAIIEQGPGKTVKSLEYDAGGHGGGHWVMTFTDGTEICFRFMAELVP